MAKEVITLSCCNVVRLRNGLVGVVACFGDTPSWLIFKAYINPLNKYDGELKHKNSNYDIMEVYDGSTIEDVNNVFKAHFTTDELPLLWKREEE